MGQTNTYWSTGGGYNGGDNLPLSGEIVGQLSFRWKLSKSRHHQVMIIILDDNRRWQQQQEKSDA